MKIQLLVAVVTALISCGASASTRPDISKQPLQVLEDRGGISTKQYMPKPSAKKARDPEKTRLSVARFPVISRTLSPGQPEKTTAQEMKYHGVMKPMFIVGYDDHSLQWLVDNREKLEGKNAIGLIVNIENTGQLEEMRDIVGDEILLQPMNGDGLAGALGIKHYPVWVDSNGISY